MSPPTGRSCPHVGRRHTKILTVILLSATQPIAVALTNQPRGASFPTHWPSWSAPSSCSIHAFGFFRDVFPHNTPPKTESITRNRSVPFLCCPVERPSRTPDSGTRFGRRQPLSEWTELISKPSSPTRKVALSPHLPATLPVLGLTNDPAQARRVTVSLGRIMSGPSLHLSAGVRQRYRKGATRVSRFFQAGGLVRP